MNYPREYKIIYTCGAGEHNYSEIRAFVWKMQIMCLPNEDKRYFDVVVMAGNEEGKKKLNNKTEVQ